MRVQHVVGRQNNTCSGTTKHARKARPMPRTPMALQEDDNIFLLIERARGRTPKKWGQCELPPTKNRYYLLRAILQGKAGNGLDKKGYCIQLYCCSYVPGTQKVHAVDEKRKRSVGGILFLFGRSHRPNLLSYLLLCNVTQLIKRVASVSHHLSNNRKNKKRDGLRENSRSITLNTDRMNPNVT